MQAGSLRQRIILEARGSEQDAFGQTTITWSPVVEVWASIEPLGGRQLESARATQNEVTHRVCMRHMPGITTAMRISFGDRFFDILSVRNVGEKNAELEIDAKEGLNDG